MVDEAMYGQLLRHARRVLPPDPALEAGDLVQGAWIKAARWLDGNRPAGEQMAYLMTAINNLARDSLRAHQRHPVARLEDWHPARASVESEAIARLELGCLLALVAAGDTFARAALMVALLGGNEAAIALGVPRVTASTRAYRFRRARLEA